MSVSYALTIDDVEPISFIDLFRKNQIKQEDGYCHNSQEKKIKHFLSDDGIEDNNYIFISNISKEIEVITETFANTVENLHKIIKNKLFEKIEQINNVGDNWIEDDGITGPNEYVIEFSKLLIEKFVDKNLFPIRITPTIEEGLCFVFENKDKILYLELYNDKDIGYIIENAKQKKIIANEDLSTYDEIVRTISNFFND